MGFGPVPARAAEGALGGKGVRRAGRRREVGKDAAPPRRVKPGSGLEPTLLGSSPSPACAVEGAPDVEGNARQRADCCRERADPSAGQSTGQVRSPLVGESGPAPACKEEGAPGGEGVAR